MKKTIIKTGLKILLVVAIFLLIIFLPSFTVENREMTINIKMKSIEVCDEMTIKIPPHKSLKYESLFREQKPKFLYIDDKEYDEDEINKELTNNTNQDKIVKVKAEYNLESSKTIKYTDVVVTDIITSGSLKSKFANLHITFNLHAPASIFEIRKEKTFNKNEINKISDTQYEYAQSNVNGITLFKLIFNRGLNDFGKEKNFSYDENNIKSILIGEGGFETFVSYAFLFTMLFILYSLYYIITSKKSKVKNIRRDFQGLVSPVIAEIINDGKIGIKELFMTVVLEQIKKGNIKIIGEEQLQLVSRHDLNEYENKVINVLFEDKNTMNFSKFKEIFTKNDKKTRQIYEYIKSIKSDILDELYNKGILDRGKKMLLLLIQCIAVVFILIINMFHGSMELVAMTMIFSPVIFICIKAITRKSRGINIILWVLILLTISAAIINTNIVNIIFNILCIILFKLANREALTDKGKIERQKILELKKYIEEYSIIKDRDMQDIVIWDDYLVYATALGIPSKITKKIYEKYMNTNMTIQKIDSMIKIF